MNDRDMKRSNRPFETNSRVYGTSPVSQATSLNWKDILRIIKKHLGVLIVILLITALGYGFGRSFLNPPQYESSATIFLTPKFDKEGDLDQSSISTNRTLLNNAIALLSRDNIMTQVAESVSTMTPDQIKQTLRVEAVSGTELISITSVTGDPQLSKKIVDSTVSAFITTMKSNLNLNNITVVDQPKLNFESVSTPLYAFILQGAGLGLVLDAVFVLLYAFLDKKLHSKEEAENYLGLPVFVVLPDIKR